MAPYEITFISEEEFVYDCLHNKILFRILRSSSRAFWIEDGNRPEHLELVMDSDVNEDDEESEDKTDTSIQMDPYPTNQGPRRSIYDE